MENYKTEDEMFNEIFLNFSPELYKWMKTQFSDVCSNTDVKIHIILEELNKVCNLKTIDRTNIEFNDVIYYIYDVYTNNFLKGENPDPFWAD